MWQCPCKPTKLILPNSGKTANEHPLIKYSHSRAQGLNQTILTHWGKYPAWFIHHRAYISQLYRLLHPEECFPYVSDRLSTNPHLQCSGDSEKTQGDVTEAAETQFIPNCTLDISHRQNLNFLSHFKCLWICNKKHFLGKFNWFFF